MSKGWKRFIKIYLVIGILWATIAKFPFGISLREYEGNHMYWNHVTNVKFANLNDSQEVVLCMQGRLAYSEQFPTSITDFSLVIPVNKITHQSTYDDGLVSISDSSSNVLRLSDKLIKKGCESLRQSEVVTIKRTDSTPAEIFDFGPEKDINQIVSENNQELLVYITPTVNTHKAFHFTDRLKVYLILEANDVAGRYYYYLELGNTWIDRDIGIHEYVIAFVKDALFYPIAIVMMGNWGH